MPKYKLRGSGPLKVVDGPMTGREFLPGVEYDEIPVQDAGRFEEIKPQPKSADKKKAAGDAQADGGNGK